VIYKLTIVDDDEKLLNKGDAIIIFNPDLGYEQLILVCPGCGKTSASAGKHRYNRDTMSYTPSIVHDSKLGGCGWHGYLTNGVFKPC